MNIWSANCVFLCLSQSILAQFNFFAACSIAIRSPYYQKEMIITTRPDLIVNQYVVSSALIGHIRPSIQLWILGIRPILRAGFALFPKNYLRIPTFLPPLFLQLIGILQTSQVLSFSNKPILLENKQMVDFVCFVGNHCPFSCLLPCCDTLECFTVDI